VVVRLEAEGVRRRHRRLHQHNAGRQTEPAPANGGHVNDSNPCVDYVYCNDRRFRHERPYPAVQGSNNEGHEKVVVDRRGRHRRDDILICVCYCLL
jgi:hypothetical protein